jgi:hypothetical protein
MQDRTKTIEYNGDVYMFDEDKHVHSLNGKPLTGVTSLIDKTLSKPALIPWAVKTTVEWIKCNCPLQSSIEGSSAYIVSREDLENAKKEHSKRKTDAGDWGTRVHNACEVWCLTGELPEGEDILPSVLNFKQFIEDNGFKVLGVERNVWSKEWWIGGIFDLVLEKDGKVYIADIKTSSGIYDSHFIQMGAYYKCILENGWQRDYGVDDFAGAIVINLKKDNTIATCVSSALTAMVDVYGSIVNIYRNRDTLDSVVKAINYGTYLKL